MAKSGPAPTINDVARIAGVSKKTVSRVINRSPLLKQATREKVEKVIAELGYTPNPQARALALRRNFLLGLLHDILLRRLHILLLLRQAGGAPLLGP